MSAPTRPVLRYRGGKWKLAPWIISHFPAHRVYLEPFGGSASVLLLKPRAPIAEIYNDLDSEIVSLFRVMRDRWQELEAALRLTPFARAEYEQANEDCSDEFEQARRTLVRFGASQGVGGHRRRSGFDAKQNPQGIVSHALAWRHYPDAVQAIAERLAGVVIENTEARELIERYDSPDTLIYADPPYVAETWKSGVYRHELTDDDHRALAVQLRAAKGFVVLSGYASGLYDRELFADWTRFERGSLADGARGRTEVLWINKRAADALQPTLFDERPPLVGMWTI